MIEAASEADEKLFEKFVDGEAIYQRRTEGRHPQGDHRDQADPGPLRIGIQEQRRAAAAGRGRGLSAVAARHSADSGLDAGSTPRLKSRKADDKEPFSALVFKIMTDPFVGQLAFFRVYSGKLEFRFVRLQLDQAGARARRPPAEDARQQARRDQGSLRGRHRRGCRTAQRHDGRHDLRREQADPARSDGFPGAGDLRRHRAEDQGRPGKDGHRAQQAGAGRSDVPDSHGSRDRRRRSFPEWASCTWKSSSTA